MVDLPFFTFPKHDESSVRETMAATCLDDSPFRFDQMLEKAVLDDGGFDFGIGAVIPFVKDRPATLFELVGSGVRLVLNDDGLFLKIGRQEAVRCTKDDAIGHLNFRMWNRPSRNQCGVEIRFGADVISCDTSGAIQTRIENPTDIRIGIPLRVRGMRFYVNDAQTPPSSAPCCEFDPYDPADYKPDEEIEASWHHRRTCEFCGEVWYSLHCQHDGYQRKCPKCHRAPTVLDAKTGERKQPMCRFCRGTGKRSLGRTQSGGVWMSALPVRCTECGGTGKQKQSA